MVLTAFLVAGAVLVLMAFAGPIVTRLPVSAAIVYLAVGVTLGLVVPSARIDPVQASAWIEVVAEVAVLISLFAVSLKLHPPTTTLLWRAPVRLATIGMALTVLMVTGLAMQWLQLPLAAALILAAILAPTDPVLASEIQLRHPDDRDATRFTLTGEGAINDGTAFPVVMLGLGLAGAHTLGHWGVRWVAVDVVWAIGAGLAIGWWAAQLLGSALRRLDIDRETGVAEEFLVLGVIALVYGIAVAVHAYGFLAVFVAGLGLRASLAKQSSVGDDLADPLRRFTSQLERLAEVAIVLLIGMMLASSKPGMESYIFALAILVLARPLSTMLAMMGLPRQGRRHALIAWFGIRGVGSIYYLAYALNHGLPSAATGRVVDAVLATIALSIVAHGVSATPLMARRS